MIKKLSIFVLAAMGMGAMTSCSDYLNSEKYFKDRQTIESTFTNRQRTEEWLAYAFTFLRGENYEITTKGPSENPFCFADDMYFGDRDHAVDATKNELDYNRFKLGEYDENTYNWGAWRNAYKGIFQASIFINNVDMCTELEEWERQDYKGQARFVRAYYYWLLLRRYGPVPIMPEETEDYTQSYEQLARPRNTYDEVVAFIDKEMLQAAQELHYDRRTDNYNITRPTRGAALATRAYVLMFAASPFANGNNDEYAQQLVDNEGNRLLSSVYDESKWAKAAAACRDVMELGAYDLNVIAKQTSDNGYGNRPTVEPAAKNSPFASQGWPNGWADIDPLRSYRSLFDGTTMPSNNKELIFTRGTTNIDMLILHQMPKSDGGWNCHGMTQKMVDAYYMNDGSNEPGMNDMFAGVAGYEGRVDNRPRRTGFTTIEDLKAGKYPELEWKYDASKADDQQDPNGLNVSLQYVEREPRFYASVAYNGSTWNYLDRDPQNGAKNKQVFYYVGNENGYRNDGFYLRTGVGIKKWIRPNDWQASNSDLRYDKNKVETAIRYADILLLYAEAINELTSSYNIPSWDGTKTYTLSRDRAEMEKGIHPVRIRAGLPDYADDVYADANKMRQTIKRERMIELMGEGKRYFDLRRWKDAPVEESLQIWGCNVFVDASKRDEFHTPIPIFNLPSTFSDKLWLWPIRHDELKRNTKLTQNPGWTMYD